MKITLLNNNSMIMYRALNNKHSLGGKQPAMISLVIMVVIAIVALAVTSLAVSTGSLLRRNTIYGEAARAAYCSEAVTSDLIAKTNLTTMFTNCAPGQCVVIGTNNCTACGETGTTVACQDSTYTPTMTCSGYARVGYKKGTSNKNITTTGDCGKSSYSVSWDYTAPAPGGPCAGGGGVAGLGVTCGSPVSSGLY